MSRLLADNDFGPYKWCIRHWNERSDERSQYGLEVLRSSDVVPVDIELKQNLFGVLAMFWRTRGVRSFVELNRRGDDPVFFALIVDVRHHVAIGFDLRSLSVPAGSPAPPHACSSARTFCQCARSSPANAFAKISVASAVLLSSCLTARSARRWPIRPGPSAHRSRPELVRLQEDQLNPPAVFGLVPVHKGIHGQPGWCAWDAVDIEEIGCTNRRCNRPHRLGEQRGSTMVGSPVFSGGKRGAHPAGQRRPPCSRRTPGPGQPAFPSRTASAYTRHRHAPGTWRRRTRHGRDPGAHT